MFGCLIGILWLLLACLLYTRLHLLFAASLSLVFEWLAGK
jgi:hypothetical protein